MTIPKGFVSTSDAAQMLGFKPTLYGRQYLSLVFRYGKETPKLHGNKNNNPHYNKAEITEWLKTNDVKATLKYARQMANGKTPEQPIDNLQQMRLAFIRGQFQPQRQRA